MHLRRLSNSQHKGAKMPCPPKVEMKAKKDGVAEILIYDRIGESFWESGVTAKQFRQDLQALGDVKQLDVRINSPGGSVNHGIAIYEALREHDAKKHVYIDGLAASMASIIAMVGDEISIAEGGFVMIHNPYGMVEGSAEDMRRFADMMDKSKAKMSAIYTGKTGLSAEDIGQMMDAETWLDADEAVAKGFANKVSGKATAVAEARLDGFRNVPQGVKDLCLQARPRGQDKEPTDMADQLKNEPVPATLAELKAACEGASAEFLLAQMEAKATEAQALKAYAAQLKADADAAKAEAAKANAVKLLPEAKAKPGVSPLAESGKESGDLGDPKAEAERMVAERMAQRKEPRNVAWRAVMSANAELRERLVACANAGRS